MKKRIVITGCAGFIGFHLAKRLDELGYDVLGYDNFNDYYLPKLKTDRAIELKKRGIEVTPGDINDKELFAKIAKGATHLIHLAAQAGVRYSITHPEQYVKTNLEGFCNVLEICRQHNLPLVYASSSSVYGLNEKTPFSVTDKTDRPASFYGATKKANELLAHSYHHLYQIPVTGLRFFTVYGPWGRPDMAYYKFAQAIENQEPIEIYNHGKMKRDFTYIDDIVDGIVAAIDYSGKCEVFNLGNHQRTDLMTFISLIEKVMGKKAEKKFLEMQKGDVKATYADIEESKEKLNFFPKTSLEEGIVKFVEWYKSYSH